MKSPLEQFDIVNVKTFNTTLVDISLNNILIPFLLLLGIIGLYLFIFNNRFNLIPFYVQNIIEKEFSFIIGLVKQQAHNYGLF
jgi:F0F1-type ATP synthase membrane subunit a